MYVVCKLDGLKIAVRKDGKQVGVRVIRHGQKVPKDEIDRWSYPNLIAHLNMGWIRWEGGGTPKHLAHKGQVVDMRAYRNPPGAEPEPAPEAERSTAVMDRLRGKKGQKQPAAG